MNRSGIGNNSVVIYSLLCPLWAIFYHAAPEVAMRLWTLGEDPDRVERLFGVPLPLAELLLCRAGVKVVPRARPAAGR